MAKTNNEKLDRILEKLRKLTDLKNSATILGNEGEANAAAAGIMRLLKEYDLTLADIPTEEKPSNPVDMEYIDYRFLYMKHHWYWDLIETIAHFNGCKTFKGLRLLDGRWQTSYEVAGRKKNREVVLYLISFLCHQFISIGSKNYKTYKLQYIHRTGYTPATKDAYMKDFLLGCVYGLYQKLKEENNTMKDDRVTALTVAYNNEIEQFLQERDYILTNSRKSTAQVDIQTMAEGYHVGKNIQINKGIGSAPEKEKLSIS